MVEWIAKLIVGRWLQAAIGGIIIALCTTLYFQWKAKILEQAAAEQNAQTIQFMADQQKKNNIVLSAYEANNEAIRQQGIGTREKLDALSKDNQSVSDYLLTPIPVELAQFLRDSTK